MVGILSIIISVFITAILFFLSKIGNPRNIEGIILLAQVSALGSSLLMSWNFILAARFKFMERVFEGLDKVYKIHNLLGNFAFILALHHLMLLIISSLPYNATKLYLIPSFNNLPYMFGIISIYLLILLVSLTIFVDMPYKLWKKTHEFMGIVIILGSIHSILVSSDISFYLPLKIWMIGINIIAICAYLYKRFWYYIYIPRNNYTVISTEQHGDYLLLNLLATDPNTITKFRSGQFGFLSTDSDPRDDHPFSVFDQVDGSLKLGTKIVGPFTLSLIKLKRGDKVSFYGPFGTFSESLLNAKKILFISGGIGITPFYSMLKDVTDNRSIYMVHSSRTDESDIFSSLFKNYNVNPNFKYIFHDSSKKGRLNAVSIKEYVPLDNEFYIYLCGPRPMMSELTDELINIGVLKKRIIFEDFSFK